MSDPQTGLTLLLERSIAERDAARVALRQAEAALAAATQQSGQLGSYRDLYRQRWGERFRVGGSATLVQCHQGFGQRLDHAIALQQSQQRQVQARADLARARVLACEQRAASVRKLIERRAADARRLADRRDQRNTDESAQRARRALPTT